MGLISGLLTFPLAPVRGVAWVAEQIKEEADRQWSDPATIQAALTDIEAMRESGEIDDAEADAREEELLQRLMSASPEQGQSLNPWEDADDE
ncbi:MAG TPA: gas vesicle protein GvpG [Nocardioidaceae bacterium]